MKRLVIAVFVLVGAVNVSADDFVATFLKSGRRAEDLRILCSVPYDPPFPYTEGASEKYLDSAIRASSYCKGFMGGIWAWLLDDAGQKPGEVWVAAGMSDIILRDVFFESLKKNPLSRTQQATRVLLHSWMDAGLVK